MADAQVWAEFCQALERAGEVVLRDRAPATPLDRAEGYRYLTRLVREMLYSTVENADPDFPRLHELDRVKIGADNPDNVYLSANIRGDRTYRITGTRGTIAYFSIGSKANRYAKDGTMASTGELSDADLVVEPDGTVEIIASATPHDKNWLPLAPDSTSLVVRQTYLDRTTEVPGRWRIECVGGRAEPRDLSPEFLTKALRRAALSVHGTAATFAHWTELFMTRPNELPDFGQEMFQRAGGDPEIFYLHGYWTLEPGQAWVIETEVPDCPYWNFQLSNWWMESLDNDRRITVNKHTATLDDGRLTIVVAPRDPGWGNWIDTSGHTSGTALLRWLGADHHPIPDCRVIDLEAT
ncbi:DUF1214 domain-containing protein [Actinophytocola algeriensis]|uniref:DUF1214 domain-containing protein n=1 Tax=Actinophytocola algeriensis TaxID=1768010 RepID=A0A7W7VGZ6_9PSEU|nr:DUF1214 domain-containing protein [Actinophytocola algeriensis]MBB4909555.1 hypothetical protein [Actinophytocola algeriensis]MBE1475545.1 hypothetical protein [Actinophytocola algeriensis]